MHMYDPSGSYREEPKLKDFRQMNATTLCVVSKYMYKITRILSLLIFFTNIP